VPRELKNKKLTNTRLANDYGGWLYCEGCQKTIGYLCYVTYDVFRLDYQCNCGSCGHVDMTFTPENSAGLRQDHLVNIKNRWCCPTDQSPLVTILDKNLRSYQCQIACKACNTMYRVEKHEAD
jgi:hypothetical protein